MEETWKDIQGYEGYYKISNTGKILSIARVMNGRIKGTKSFLKERQRKQQITDGYYCILLNKDGKSKTHKVHRLLAIAFIPNPLNKLFINHINGIRSDNHLENLEWCSPKENTQHAANLNLLKRLGSKNGLAKITEENVLMIRRLYYESNYSIQTLAQFYEMSNYNVIRIVKNLTWKHVPHEYADQINLSNPRRKDYRDNRINGPLK